MRAPKSLGARLRKIAGLEKETIGTLNSARVAVLHLGAAVYEWAAAQSQFIEHMRAAERLSLEEAVTRLLDLGRESYERKGKK